MARQVIFQEPASGLSVRAALLDEQAPDNAAFLWAVAGAATALPAIHAMWTGPEISCPVPAAQVPPDFAGRPLPPENSTINPLPGDVVVAYLPARVWGGSPEPIYDIGLFYAAGARLLFPVGWIPGSVCARVAPADLPALAEACAAIRRRGACTMTLAIDQPPTGTGGAS